MCVSVLKVACFCVALVLAYFVRLEALANVQTQRKDQADWKSGGVALDEAWSTTAQCYPKKLEVQNERVKSEWARHIHGSGVAPGPRSLGLPKAKAGKHKKCYAPGANLFSLRQN